MRGENILITSVLKTDDQQKTLLLRALVKVAVNHLLAEFCSAYIFRQPTDWKKLKTWALLRQFHF